MQTGWTNKNIIRIVVIIVITLFLLFGVAWLFMQITSILFYFIIAAIISLIGKPICDFIERFRLGRFRIPDALSSLITIILLYAVLIGLVKIFTPLVIEQTNTIAKMDTERVAAGIQQQMQNIDSLIIRFQNPDVPQQSVQQIINENLQTWINVTSVTHIFNNLLGGLGNIIVAVFSITFIAFFFLKDDKLFYNIVMILAPVKYEPKAKVIMHTSKKYLTRYFVGLIIQSLVVFILIAAGLLILGFGQKSWLIALFAGMVNIIPYIGPIIGMLFGMLIGVTTHLSIDPSYDIMPLLINLFILFQGVQLLDNFVSQPIIYSNSIKAHPLEVFFIVLVFGSLAGVPGMIAAMPVYAFFRIIAREFFSEFKLVRKMTQHID